MSNGNEISVERLKQRPEKIHALTSLRFFAALFVVLFHTMWSVLPSMTHQSLGGRILSLGFLSVSFFFLLSGYILGMVYLRPQRRIGKRNFYIARFARVYPLFFITLILDTPALLGERIAHYGLHSAIAKTAVTFVGNIFMLQAWVPIFRGIDNPNWSLSVETVFYLLFPVVGAWLWRLRGQSLWIVAGTIWIVSQVAVFFATNHVSDIALKTNPLFHIGTFVLGILLARWQTLQREKNGASPRNSMTISIGILLILVSSLLLVLWEPRPVEGRLSDGLLTPVFACLVWVFSANEGMPARLLSANWLVVLGEASFGLYLIHIPVLHLFAHFGLEGVPAFFPVFLVVSIGLSVVSFYYVETPIRKWILKRFQTRPKETLEAASDAQ